MMTISIIIPVYNVERYIAECLDSVASQQNPGAHIECILVDDCSPDRSVDVVRSFIDRCHMEDVTFRLLRHQTNRGLSAARNTGIGSATGDYLLFLDSDDYLTMDAIATMMTGFSLCPDADVIQANITDGRNGDRPYYECTSPKVLRDRKEQLLALASDVLPVIANNRLVRRELVVNKKIYFIEGILFEDNPWSYRLMGEASTVVILPQATYYYRFVETSITHTRQANIKKMIDSWRVIMTEVLRLERNVRGYILLHTFARMLEAKDMMSHQDNPADVRRALKEMQCKLVKGSLLYVRPMLFLLFLTIYRPLYAIYSLGFVRHYYYLVEGILIRLELKIDSRKW